MKKLVLVLCFLLVLCIAGSVNALEIYQFDVVNVSRTHVNLGDYFIILGLEGYDEHNDKSISVNFFTERYGDHVYTRMFGQFVFIFDGIEYFCVSQGSVENESGEYYIRNEASGIFSCVSGNLDGKSSGNFHLTLGVEPNDDPYDTEDVIGYFYGELNLIVDDYEQRISALESWKTAIETTVQAIEDQLESVKQWLFFWNYQSGDVCEAIENDCEPSVVECSSDDDCGTEEGLVEWVGPIFCSDGDLYHDFIDWSCVNPGTEESYCDQTSTLIMIEECEYGCDSAAVACNPEPTAGNVIFRTNVVQGDGENYNLGTTSDGLGAWISFDLNDDDVLEGYGKTNGAIRGMCGGADVGTTPDGFKLISYRGDLGVCYRGDTGNARKYATYDSDAENAVLSSEPTEPYASNGQERYE